MFNKLKYKIFFTNIHIQKILKRFSKKALAFVLAFAMLVATFPHFALEAKAADYPTDYWTDSNNNPSTTWYTGHSSPYTINTAQDLAGLAKLVNAKTDSFSGKTINLSAGIDLSAHLWTPIGNNITTFQGTFDGQNHIINGLTTNKTSADYQGLFGYSHGCTMQNIGLTNTRISAQSYVGGIAGCLYNSTISNCYNMGNISGAYRFIGGIVGVNNSSIISNCYNMGNISGADSYIGGIVGHTLSAAISICYNMGKVSGKSCIGGISGAGYSSSIISNCYNMGVISATASDAGGISGGLDDNGQVSNCYNTGSISGNFSIGGISGYTWRSNIDCCYNTGEVIGNDRFQGIAGYHYSGAGVYKITNCFYLTGITYDGNATPATAAQLQGVYDNNNPPISLTSKGFSKSPFYNAKDLNAFNKNYLVLDAFYYGDTVTDNLTGTEFHSGNLIKTPTFTSTAGHTIMPIDPSMYKVAYTKSGYSSTVPPTETGTYSITVVLDEYKSGYRSIVYPANSNPPATYSQSDRKLSKLDSGTTSPINVAADASYTMQFSTNTYSASQAINHQLNFDKALPVGTGLTFVDHSSEKPNYYYYNVEKEVGANTPLFLNLFSTMDPTNTLYTDPGSLSPPETITETLLFVVDFSQVVSESRLSGDLLSTLNIDGIDIDHITATITAASSSSGSISNTPETTDVSVDASSSNPGDEVLLVATLTKSINDVEKQISWSDTIKINGTYNQKIFENIKGGLAVLDLGKAQSTTTNYSLSGLTISGLPSGTYNLKLSVCVTSSSNASYPTKDIKASLAIPITIQV